MIEYEDFSLKIEPKRGEVYPVIVLRSPAGEGRSSFKLPFDPDEIGDILFDLGRTVRGGGQAPLRDVSPAATRTRPQQIGDQLFNALFSGPVRSLLDRSLGMIHGRQRGLRIKLHIDPEDPSLAQLASLPWEFLYRKETRDFLNLSRFTPILRYLDVQRPYTPLSLEPPLRILVVISDPAGYIPLDLDRERAQIEASWARQKGVQVEFMEQATILALQDRLADQTYHVLHYMGHGDFDERTGQGVLVMEDEDGRGAIVDGSTLGVLLRDLPTMCLVFLNACETARVTKEKGLDPFAGVAAAMVMAGIPAVVAMQFPISDSAAITFSQKFYPLLARGDPVDAAVAEGRRAIRLAEARTMEWGTPVLFMRAPQGVIFQVTEVQRAKVPIPEMPELPPEVDEELEQRLEQLYTDGLSAFWLEKWEKAIRNFQAIVNVRPDYEDAADKLAEARRQAKLHALYAQAQAAQEAEDWSGALAALEELAAEAADFKDTAERLQVVRKQKQLADLYAEAQRLHQAQQWQAVVNVFGQIQAIKPDYADPDELLPTAEQEVAKQKRQAELNNLYSRAVREMDAGRWPEARQLLAQVEEMEPSFHETERLLAKVEEEIERERTERQRQEQIATLYEQALGLARARQWRQVQAKMEEIQTLDPEFADPEGIADRAQEEVTREEEEARRQSELAALYAEAVRWLKAGQYQEALEKWGEVRARDPQYPDRQKVQATARKKLAALAKGAPPKRGLPRWAVVAIGGFAVVAVVAAIALLSRGIPGLLPTPTWTPAPVAVTKTPVPTATPTPLPATRRPTATATRTRIPPTRTPTPTATIDADRTVYDNFDNPAYDGSFNPSRWGHQTHDSGGRVYQEDGVLVLIQECQEGKTLGQGIGGNYLGFDDALFFEAKLKLDASPGSQGSLILGIGMRQGGVLECEIMAGQPPTAGCQAEAYQDNPVGITDGQTVLEGWHQIRVELYPDDELCEVYLDDKPIGCQVPSEADKLWSRVRSSAVYLAVWTYPGASGTKRGYVDDVRIGPIEKLYSEDFETGQASGWDLESGWQVEQDGDNYVLSGSGHKWATLLNNGWDDYRVRFRLKLQQGAIHLNYRLKEVSGGLSRYRIGFTKEGLYLAKSVPREIDLTEVSASHALNRWYDVEIVGLGEHLQIYVDGDLVLDYTDPQPVQSGTIAFETLDDSRAQVDDIEVWPSRP